MSTVVSPVGDLCEDTIEPFEQSLRVATGDVSVDLSRVRIAGAAAMRVLVKARARLEAQGGSLLVDGASPFVARTLELVGLGDLLAQRAALAQPRAGNAPFSRPRP